MGREWKWDVESLGVAGIVLLQDHLDERHKCSIANHEHHLTPRRSFLDRRSSLQLRGG